MTSKSLASIVLCGGLGNQCFQVMALLAYAIKTNRNVILSNESDVRRPLVYWDTVFCALFMMHGQEIPTITILDRQEYAKKTQHFFVLPEHGFSYAPLPVISDKIDVMFHGYFQSHLYCSDEKLVANVLTINSARRELLDMLWRELMTPLQEKSNVVSLHVRRGDYLLYPQIHPTLNKDYYDKAMQLYEEDSVFMIFSDDVTWCKQTWQKKTNVIFVPDTLKDHESFHLMMYYCQRGNIIANSSFSWWPAYVGWLTTNKTKKIVVPKIWCGEKGPPLHSLHVPGWIVLDE